jgi:hypothetical protein
VKILTKALIVLAVIFSIGCASNQTRAMNGVKIVVDHKLAVSSVCSIMAAAKKAQYVTSAVERELCNKMAITGTRNIVNHYVHITSQLDNGSK